MERVQLKRPQLSRAEFHGRADEYLKKAQAELMPKHAAEIISINMVTGEYVLGEDAHESYVAFRANWPNCLAYQCRVDGRPADKFHGYVPV